MFVLALFVIVAVALVVFTKDQPRVAFGILLGCGVVGLGGLGIGVVWGNLGAFYVGVLAYIIGVVLALGHLAVAARGVTRGPVSR